MKSGNHASYAKIGFAIIAGTVASVIALVWLGGVRGSRHAIFVETYYDREVSGLSVGSPVNFRGVKIGEVREVDFVGNRYEAKGDDNLRIYILMALDARKLNYYADEGIPVEETVPYLVRKRGLYATVTPSGITGLSRIECNLDAGGGAGGHAVETYPWTPEHPVVPRKISLMDNFSDAATRIVNQVNAMDLVSVWSNVNSSVESLAATLRTVSGVAESCRGDVERAVESAAEAAADLRGFAGEVRANPASLLRDRPPQPLDETR